MSKVKYRILSKSELEELEKEFIDFLVINGVTADEWESIKKTDKGDGIISAFSDVVFESIMRKTHFLEHWSSRSVKTFQCLESKLILVGADLQPEVDIDLLHATPGELQEHFTSFHFYTSEKEYKDRREQDIFGLIESGCKISDGALYKRMLLAMTS